MNTCLMCGREDFVYKPYGRLFKLLPKETKIQVCVSCGFGRVTRFPDPKLLEDYYKADCYQQWHKQKEIRQLESLPHSQALNQYDLMAPLVDFESINSLLDFGCGSAMTARTIKIRHSHITISVVELSQSLRTLLTNCNEIDNVYDKIPTNLPLQDLIIISGTLEHLLNPIAAVRKFRGLLTERGYLLIEVPNCLFPYYYTVKKAHIPHLFFFTKNSFIQMAATQNFELVWADSLGMSLKEWCEETKDRLSIVTRAGTCYASNKYGVYLRALLRKKGD